MRVWIVYWDGCVSDAIFSNAEKAYNYMVEGMERIISGYNAAGRISAKRDYEDMLEELTKEYNEDGEEFGCDECWAKPVEVN